MRIFSRNKQPGGIMDVIRCDEPSYLIWKWHPSGPRSAGNARENSIRWGSSLRVKDGEVAVFVYEQDCDTMQDFIVGPFDQILKTANFPVLSNIVGFAYEGSTPFQAEVYFINLSQIIQVRFGVPFFDVYDPRFEDFGVPVAVRGTISFRIRDFKEFVKLHRLYSFRLEDFQAQIRDGVCRYVKDAVANAPAANNIPLVQIESRISQINDIVEYDLSERLKESFGVEVSGVDIGAIEIDKTSIGYRQLMSVTKELAGATVKTENEAKNRDILSRQRIEAEHYEGTLRIQREEGQYARHKNTQTSNLSAFQIEKQAEVGVAGAAALGQMGASVGLNENPGSGGEGFNMTTMMASMAVGGAVGQNLAGILNNMMGGINQRDSDSVPPPIPLISFYVAVNGQAAGPYDISTLQRMSASGCFSANSLVWTTGMTKWVRADSVNELNGLFIPPIPSE